MIQYLLFDFDGTLFDTGPGVMRCVQYAVEKLGKPALDETTLRRFVGPPLDESFIEFCGLSPEGAREAIRLYRERYQPTGIWECEPYPGMPELLDELKAAGFRIAVCTSKPTAMAVRILERYGMVDRFDSAAASLTAPARRSTRSCRRVWSTSASRTPIPCA